MELNELRDIEQGLERYRLENPMNGNYEAIIDLMLMALREDIAQRQSAAGGRFGAPMPQEPSKW